MATRCPLARPPYLESHEAHWDATQTRRVCGRRACQLQRANNCLPPQTLRVAKAPLLALRYRSKDNHKGSLILIAINDDKGPLWWFDQRSYAAQKHGDIARATRTQRSKWNRILTDRLARARRYLARRRFGRRAELNASGRRWRGRRFVPRSPGARLLPPGRFRRWARRRARRCHQRPGDDAGPELHAREVLAIVGRRWALCICSGTLRFSAALGFRISAGIRRVSSCSSW